MVWKLEELACAEFPCGCGRVHKVPIKRIRLSRGAIGCLEEDVPEMGLTGTALIVADETTFEVAGREVESTLQQMGIPAKTVILRPRHSFTPSHWVLADERSLGEVLIRLPDNGGFLVAVGSGTINDITRFVAHKTGRPFICIGTAPSMDGYASTVAPILTGSFKKSMPATCPTAIYIDPDILAAAPQEMAAAGFGDIIGKSIALADWRLSHIINGEYYCPVIASIVEQVLSQVLEDVSALSTGDPDALLRLAEGLILSGVAILMFGDSRPAAGAEHELAHFWEIKGLERGRLCYHGDKVAIGTLIVTEIYQRMLALEPKAFDWEKVYAERLPLAQYKQIVQQDFAEAWEALYSPHWDKLKNQELARRTGELVVPNWNRIQEEVPKSLLPIDSIREYLSVLGLCQNPQELGIEKEWVEAGLRSAKEMRPHRYTIMNLAAEMGCLETIGGEIVQKIFG